MSEQYPGGFVTKSPPTPQGNSATSSAYGIWNLSQQAAYQAQGLWPDPANLVDAQFNYVTMLLHGDGTNGAQNNTFLDSSASPLTITRNGNTTQGSFSPYGSNWSNYFGSTSDYLTTNSGAIDNLTSGSSGDYTVEAWVYLTTAPSGTTYSTCAPIAAKIANTNGLYQFWGITSTGYISISRDGASYITATGTTPSLNTWNHLAFVNSGTTITVYLNGTSVATMSCTGTWYTSGTSPLTYIGRNYYASLIGYISNLRMVAGTAVYTGAFTPSTTPLTTTSQSVTAGNVKLLTCQSNRFVDNSNNAYAVSIVGSPSVQRFNPFGTSTAYSTATFGGSAYCDGTGDYLNFTEQTISGDFTLEGYFYPTLTSGTKQQCLFGGTSTNTQLCIDEYNYGGIGYYNNGVRFDLGRFSGAPFFSHNCWNHFAYVKSSGTVTLYINGVSQAGSGGSVSDGGTFALSAVLGNVSYGLSFLGYANIRVSTTARYTSNFTPATSPWTSDASTLLLIQMTNGAIYDNAMMNDLETVGNAQISTSVVKYGTGSLYFDGTGDYLKGLVASPNFQFGTGDFTIEMWVYSSNLAAYQTLLDTRAADSTTAYGLFLNDSGYPYWFDANGTQTSTISVTSNTWTYLAFLRGSGTLRIYVNGVQGSFATNTNAMNPTGIPRIGMNVSGSAPYLGYIDDLRITKGYARTPTTPTTAFPNTGPN